MFVHNSDADDAYYCMWISFTLYVNPDSSSVVLTLNFLYFEFFYGCEAWFLALREEHRMRVFENRVLRRIFGCKSEEVMAG
jgi:hypothetical protein